MELSAGVMTNGTMIFGGVNGINVFRPDDFDVIDFNGSPTLVDFKSSITALRQIPHIQLISTKV